MPPANDISRFLRSLAFEIRRKRPAAEAMADCIEQEGRGGRHRQFRQAASVLDQEGVLAALQAAGLIGQEAAVLLALILAEQDHRLLAAALSGLADFHDRGDL